VGLAGEVLALHDAIRDVLVVENRAGDMHVIDQAERIAPSFEESLEGAGKDSIVAPTLILGAASHVGKVWRSGELSLIGMLYDQLGILCAPVDENTYLMATTSSQSLLEVSKTVHEALPSLIRKRFPAPSPLAVGSASDADQAVRSFFGNTRLSEPNQVHMDQAILNSADHSWQVSGSYRPTHALRSKHYRIELDAKTGAVTKFEAVA